ncbi:hypothetical protein HMPREF9151_01745 [Hoylesella saccharolytica F0055]|uniref:Hemagglutinin protein HagB n=1 Tax=Hoylesella saccharolytica F0055 TaxID=1127699 RepID=L1N763_9BACT|nr:DUF6261 family protein [Hoylesella saccharolytica]EKX99318.1 hypothetical protein HMPREF9151_01745 [Hoylesella saccharolytica F0055]
MKTDNLLPKMVRFRKTYLYSFNNALHTEFHRVQYDLVSKVESSKLNIAADLLASWKASIDLEIDIVKESAASVITKELDLKDHERDNVFTQLFSLVRAYRISFLETEKMSAEKLYIALKPYFGIQRGIKSIESIHILSLLKDTDKLTAEVTALGLEPVLTQLKKLNEEYEKLESQRRKDAVETKLPNSRSVRRETDEYFEVICQYIQAAYLLATKKDDKALVLKLVNEMNQVSADLRTSHKASIAQKKAHAKVEDLEPETDEIFMEDDENEDFQLKDTKANSILSDSASDISDDFTDTSSQ